MKRLLALVLAALALQAQAQLPCTPSAPRADPGTGFTPFATLERLEVRSGRLGAADWEWGLGVNTQSAGQFATANLDWVNERVYDWTLSYSGTGSAMIEVRDGGTVLFTRTWASGMDAGNALKLYVKSTAGIAAGNLVSATSATINGQPAAGSLQTAGTGAFSEARLYWFYPAMSQGFTATGTVKLTFTGSYPPTGSRLNFIVTAGNLPCAPEPTQAKLYFIHTDHLNTPRLISDDQQRTVWRWDNTDPFGGNPPDENPSGLGVFEFPLRLPGQYFDRETNLHYNYYRDYDPSLGRYEQSDPIGLRGGINTYSYVGSQVLLYVDPFGLIWQCTITFELTGKVTASSCVPCGYRTVTGIGRGGTSEIAKLVARQDAEIQTPPNCNLGRAIFPFCYDRDNPPPVGDRRGPPTIQDPPGTLIDGTMLPPRSRGLQ